LVDSFLLQQQQLTAVEQFSQWHDRPATTPAAHPYRQLIPLHAPRPGEQYAFEVDLDRCSGCKGCVTACHALNGLDEDETWREVGLLVGVRSAQSSVLSAQSPVRSALQSIQQTVTTACHHCLEPACLLGCPVLAYDKDPGTGIVRHLDDQCIGCSYCLMMCPYEVPKYSAKRGIVRKCDLCHGRLAAQEAPACVQACPSAAIRITLVETAGWRSELAALADDGHPANAQTSRPSGSPTSQRRSAAEHAAADPPPRAWLADSPDPLLTLPTTRYVSARPGHDLLAADHGQPRPAPSHWPLVLMLVFTQCGAGALVAALQLGSPQIAASSLALVCAGLGASVFHLGQPRKAWRIWLGWRTSWLSREAVALNAFAATGLAALALVWNRHDWAWPISSAAAPAGLIWALGALATVMVWTQTMVYAKTGRTFWRVGLTLPRFLGTNLLAGGAVAFWLRSAPAIAVALVVIALLKVGTELSVLKHADSDADQWTALRRTAVLQGGPLRGLLALRLLLIGTGGLLVFAVAVGSADQAWAGVGLLAGLLGELAERLLFFTSVAPDKMPGLP